MKVTFTTKKESKRLQEKEFLALSPHERLLNFIALSKAISKLYPKREVEDSNHFVIDLSKARTDA